VGLWGYVGLQGKRIQVTTIVWRSLWVLQNEIIRITTGIQFVLFIIRNLYIFFGCQWTEMKVKVYLYLPSSQPANHGCVCAENLLFCYLNKLPLGAKWKTKKCKWWCFCWEKYSQFGWNFFMQSEASLIWSEYSRSRFSNVLAGIAKCCSSSAFEIPRSFSELANSAIILSRTHVARIEAILGSNGFGRWSRAEHKHIWTPRGNLVSVNEATLGQREQDDSCVLNMSGMWLPRGLLCSLELYWNSLTVRHISNFESNAHKLSNLKCQTRTSTAALSGKAWMVESYLYNPTASSWLVFTEPRSLWTCLLCSRNFLVFTR